MWWMGVVWAATPSVSEPFPAFDAATVDGAPLAFDPERYTVVEAIRSVDW